MTTATASTAQTAAGVRWDLSSLYRDAQDPKIAEDSRAIADRVRAFASHRGAVAKADAAALRKLLEEFESLTAAIDRLRTFADLLASADTQDPARTKLRDELTEKASRHYADLVFFELEWKQLPDARAKELLAAPALASYKHYLQRLRDRARYTLSEAEERIILKKNIAGHDALVIFREEFAAKVDFSATIGGVERKTEEDLLNVLRTSTRPDDRAAAANRIYGVYRQHEEVFAFIFKNVLKDHAIECELRGYERPIDVENVRNEVPYEVVQALIASTRKHLPLIHEYYGWKGRAMGLPRLRTCDRMAPIAHGDLPKVTWSEARRMVERCLETFDPEFQRMGKRFFDENRVDAASVQGKRGGAFCCPVPERDPFVLLSFTDDVDATFTLAHEVGHGIHFMLAGRAQRVLQAFEMSKVLAETASEFNESLLLDRLLEESKDPALKVHLLTHACDGFLGVVPRQVCFTEFELAAHEQSKSGSVTVDFCRDKWKELAHAYYGPHVDLMPDETWGCFAIPHFLFNPFYCLSYALSQVAVLALYARWKREGKAFVPAYRALLEAGGSGAPVPLLARAGVDLTRSENLDGAFETFRERFERLKSLIKV